MSLHFCLAQCQVVGVAGDSLDLVLLPDRDADVGEADPAALGRGVGPVVQPGDAPPVHHPLQGGGG